jgi:hypothetical protein
VASSLNWKEKGITLRQETAFPYEAQTRLTITGGKGRFPLLLRYPGWVESGALKVLVNGKAEPVTSQPSSYVVIDRQWQKGDVVSIDLPMHTTLERLPNVPAYTAFLHGPIVLGAKSGTEGLRGLVADESRWGHIASGERLPVDKAPGIVEDDLAGIAAKLIPVKGKPLQFTLSNLNLINPANLVLEPFFSLHDARYMLYWMTLTRSQYRSYLDSLRTVETEKLALQNRTVDVVAPGEQQPEVDHQLQSSGSRTGTNHDKFYREAANGGHFSYSLATGGETGLSLLVEYWGAEWGTRRFDIYIDEEKLLTEDNTGRWNQSKFQTISYKIPETMLKGKKMIRVKFQSLPGSTAGGVYHVRLVRAEAIGKTNFQ